MGGYAKLLCGCALASLAGCATFDGRPRAVMTVQQADAMLAAYRPDQVIQTMGGINPADIGARNTYRNRVVAANLTAIDLRYGEFVRALSRSGKGAHVGFDSALLALTGAGAIFAKAASDLSAGAGAVAGLRSSFDREVFAEKTLPILVSLMDSHRLAVRSEILRGLSKPESVYTVEDAYADLVRYEGAGTIDSAIADAATAAGARAQVEARNYAEAKDLCVVDDGTDDARRGLMTALEKFETDAEGTKDAQAAVAQRTAVQLAARAVGIADAAVPADKDATWALIGQISDQVEAQCKAADVAALAARIKAALNDKGIAFQ